MKALIYTCQEVIWRWQVSAGNTHVLISFDLSLFFPNLPQVELSTQVKSPWLGQLTRGMNWGRLMAFDLPVQPWFLPELLYVVGRCPTMSDPQWCSVKSSPVLCTEGSWKWYCFISLSLVKGATPSDCNSWDGTFYDIPRIHCSGEGFPLLLYLPTASFNFPLSRTILATELLYLSLMTYCICNNHHHHHHKTCGSPMLPYGRAEMPWIWEVKK